jgi:hypothetical protein
MSLLHPKEIAGRVESLLRDVGPLQAVSAIGFSEKDEATVERCLGALGTSSEWRYLDLREGPSDELSRLTQSSKAIVIAVRARADFRALVELIDRRAPGPSVVLVVEGASSIEDVSRPLARIPHWDFIG